jgi:glycerol-3-phosphate acyltransferase PlsX
VQAIKTKKTSSLVCALNSVASREAEVMVSAGSTGAVLAGATLIVKRIRGIKRAALAPVMPTADNHGVLLIDCGANVDCKPEFLQQFALMGSVYMNCLFGMENPRVGLINNGAEPEKGNALAVAAHQLLLNTPVHFVGNAEARDIYSGAFDVVVADGFVGNAVLKVTEGIASMLFDMIKDEMMGSFRTKMGALLAKPAFKHVKKKLDYTEYGGALLLGIDGGVIKAHGSSNAKAICSTILQAKRFIEADVVHRIKQQMSQLSSQEL